jgi:hypothetical protein
MSSFLTSASRQVVDVRSFLRDSAGGNSIKYTAVSGENHHIFIPYSLTQVADEAGNMRQVKQIIAIQGNVHEWTSADNKYRATICLKDVVRKGEDGTVLNDGTCPFCARVSDAWEIYKYRKAAEEENCKLTGDARKSHMEKVNTNFADERKAKDARPYIYLLIVKFRTDANNGAILEDGLPAYDLKVMKLSASRVEKIQTQLTNSGIELAGAELMFGYPKNDDRRLVVTQSTTSPIFPTNQNIVKYPGLLDKINNDIAKFSWEGIEKSFSEWSGMTSIEAKNTTDALFEKWDEYQAEIKVNPQAKYLEYLNETPTNAPAINPVAGMGMPVVPQIPGAQPAQPAQPVMPSMPTMPTGMPVMPGQGATATDPNSIFAGVTPSVPTI